MNERNPLAGTWTLMAADAIRPDGSRIRDYGESPRGSLIVDSTGHYALQIFKAERPRFGSDDKSAASASEFKAAVMGSSTHFGHVDVDTAGRTLTFDISASSFPNWEGTRQTRHFELTDKVLTYQVQARPDGNIPVSIWKRTHRP